MRRHKSSWPMIAVAIMAAFGLYARAEAAPPTVDCTGTNADCPILPIAGYDPPRMANGEISWFRGMADPVLRASLDGKTIWLAYSTPSFGVFPAGPGGKPGLAVDVAYAKSVDGGKTWRQLGVLWPSVAENDVSTGVPGRSYSEVANLAPYKHGGKTGWFGARYFYLIPAVRDDARRIGQSASRIVLYQAPTVPELAGASPAVVGGNTTNPKWGVEYDFSKLAPETAKCGSFGEPALRVEGDRLYVMLRCFLFPAPAEHDTPIMVFSTTVGDSIHGLKWTYRGVLAGRKEALELGIPGAQAFTEDELATGQDGKLLAILMPDHGNDPVTRHDIHYGCRVFEVASLDKPALARDADGKLVIRAVVLASDEPDGTSSCGYDAASATGIVVARRERYVDKVPPLQVMTLNATGLRP